MTKGEQRLFDLFFTRYPALTVCRESIFKAYICLKEGFEAGGTLFTCGNGGSAADAQHIVGELMKGFVLPRALSNEQSQKLQQHCPTTADYLIENLQGALPAVSLQGELALQSAYANDQAPDLCFAQQVWGLGKRGDMLLGISTSGNSKNVLYALQVARVKGMKTLGLSGESGGRIKEWCDVAICVPSKQTYQIQEYHLPIYHLLCLMLEEGFFGKENTCKQ